LAKISFVCLCPDPYYYYETGNTDTQNIAASPTLFSINNPSDFFVFPVIEITNTANNPSLQLKNITDNDRSFNYVDAAFLNGDVLTVDCVAGTVFKGIVNSIGYFAGNFIRLLPENNEFEYTGANCQILTTWTKREL
jgi:phage-related protein